MSKALESGRSLLAAVLAKLPESLRADAEKAFTAPEATDALTILGDSALARSDYSRSMDEIKEKEAKIIEDYEKLNTWYKENQPRLDSVATLEAEVARLKGVQPRDPNPPAPATPVGLDSKAVNEILDQRDRGYTSVLALTTQLATQHLRDFNEILDVNDLITLASQKQYSLKDAYLARFGERIAAKATEAENARINKLVEDRLHEERRKYVDQPFPLRNQSPSPLDVLETKTDPATHNLDTALAEYERLQGARG